MASLEEWRVGEGMSIRWGEWIRGPTRTDGGRGAAPHTAANAVACHPTGRPCGHAARATKAKKRVQATKTENFS